MRLDKSSWSIALSLCLLFAVSPAQAGDAGDGEVLAKRWCSNCHQVGSRMTAQDAVPPLREVAARPYATRDWLTGWLTDPHLPMPKLNLTRREIDNLVSYLLTLRPPR